MQALSRLAGTVGLQGAVAQLAHRGGRRARFTRILSSASKGPAERPNLLRGWEFVGLQMSETTADSSLLMSNSLSELDAPGIYTAFVAFLRASLSSPTCTPTNLRALSPKVGLGNRIGNGERDEASLSVGSPHNPGY